MASPTIQRPIIEHLPESQTITGYASPRLSWRFGYDASTTPSWTQSSYELEMTGLTGTDTYKVDTADSVLVPWPRAPLVHSEQVSVRVRAYGCGAWTCWSDPATIEASLLDASIWKAQWITSAQRLGPSGPLQPLCFYKTFNVSTATSKARLYISALGVYNVYINGHEASDEFMAPGWTSYNHRVAYRALDISPFTEAGANVICVEVAEGWYAGRLGFKGGKRFCYGGDELALLAQVEMDGQMALTSDESWSVAASAIQLSEIYDGEVYDATAEWDNWKTTPPTHASPVKMMQPPSRDMAVFFADVPPVRVTQTIRPVATFKSNSGKTIVDFGQNLVGKLLVENLSAPRGHRTTFLYAEVMEHGELGTRPLRLAKCSDTVISDGRPLARWTPSFTFHGFRYVEVDGWPAASGEPRLTALVTHTDMRRRGFFACSNASVNQLHRNVVWSMRGNFLSIPTDCPQRDERLGWTGDLQIFAPSATFLYDTVGMLSVWLQDVALEQLEEGKGAIPRLVCPDVLPPNWPHVAQAVWDDIVVLTPMDLYRLSGDVDILRRQFASMEAYLSTAVVRDDDGLWDFDRWQLADWLDPSAPPDDPGNGRTDGVLVADAYLVRVTETFADVCAALGKQGLADKTKAEAALLRGHFQDKYMTPRGNLMSSSQTGLALAVENKLYKSREQLAVAAAALKKLVRSARFHIATGFAGTPIITHALTRVGKPQLAYRMLLETTCPSWMYPITMGATTIWERWDSMLADGSVNPGQMTSFNHYALGAVADWLHGTVGGLAAAAPGWRRVRVAPVPGGNLTSAKTSFEGPYGWVKCRWELRGQAFTMEVEVPPNTTAEIVLPSGDDVTVVGSGVHRFECVYRAGEWPPEPIVAINQPQPANDTIAE